MNRPHKEVRMSHAKPIPGAITGPAAEEDKAKTIPGAVTAPKESCPFSEPVPGTVTTAKPTGM